jgi:hypothetical protein
MIARRRFIAFVACAVGVSRLAPALFGLAARRGQTDRRAAEPDEVTDEVVWAGGRGFAPPGDGTNFNPPIHLTWVTAPVPVRLPP